MNRARLCVDLRESGGAFIVTALSAAFGAIMMTASTAIANAMAGEGLDAVAQIRSVLEVISWLFLGIALFVGAIVTVNTFGTIVAGRARRLALLRLLGASARSLRQASMVEGLIVGSAGAVAGTAAGAGLAQAVLAAGRQWWSLSPSVTAPPLSAAMLAPALAACLVTVVSSWFGSRSIMSISPVAAFGSAQMGTETVAQPRLTKPAIVAVVVLLTGGLLLTVLGVGVGIASPFGVLIAFPGCVATFTAFMISSSSTLPPLLSIGSAAGASAPARLAARNTARHPRRSARACLGVIIGVGLVTMFAVVASTYQRIAITEIGGMESLTAQEADEMYRAFQLPMIVVMTLVGFSAVIAAVGLVNSMTLSAIQRRSEIAVLRAIGLTRSQVRLTALLEGARMSAAAVIVGVVLGVFYGWIGSLSALGSLMKANGMWAPVLPGAVVIVTAAGAVLLTAAAAVATMRRSVSVSPIEAMAAT